MCFAWSVLYYLSPYLLVLHNHPCRTHLFDRDTHYSEIIRIIYVLHLYLLSYIVFALVIHLYILEHDGGFVLWKILFSHASLRLF